jgi:hypothetical protein
MYSPASCTALHCVQLTQHLVTCSAWQMGHGVKSALPAPLTSTVQKLADALHDRQPLAHLGLARPHSPLPDPPPFPRGDLQVPYLCLASTSLPWLLRTGNAKLASCRTFIQ